MSKAKLTWFGDKAIAKIKENVSERVKSAGEHLFKIAKETVPVKTGHTKSQIDFFFDKKKLISIIQTNYVGRFLETGTRKMKATKWFSKAIEKSGIDVQIGKGKVI